MKILYLISLAGVLFLASCSNVCRKEYMIKGDYISKKPIGNFDFSERVTCSMKGATIEDVLDMLPNGFSVVYDEKLLDVPIFGELRNASYAEFFAVVAQNLNCQVEKLGGVYVFSTGVADKNKLADSPASTGNYRYFFRLSGIPKSRINELFQPYKIKYIGSSKFLFVGSVRDAVNCDVIYKEVLESLPSEYVFDLYFINEDVIKDLYLLDGKTGGVFGLSYGVGNAVASSAVDWSYVLSLTYDMGISYSRSKGFRVLSGVFTEDVPYTVTIGDSVPIINKSVLDSGVVVESGVTYQDIGLNLSISCEGLTRGVVTLSLSVTDSSGSLNGYPIRHGSTIKTCFSVADDDYHFVGSFFGDTAQNKVLGANRSVSCFYVVCRVRRLSENQSVLMDIDQKMINQFDTFKN